VLRNTTAHSKMRKITQLADVWINEANHSTSPDVFRKVL